MISLKFFNSLYTKRIMEELKIEIRERGTFELLSDEIEKIMRREKGEEAVFKEQEKLRESAKKLQGMIDERKIVNEKEKRRILNEVTKEQVSPLYIYIYFSLEQALKFLIFNNFETTRRTRWKN